jgi:hypothetical protein
MDTSRKVKVAGWVIEKASNEEMKQARGYTPDFDSQRTGYFRLTCCTCNKPFGVIAFFRQHPITFNCPICGHTGTVYVSDMENMFFHEIKVGEFIDPQAPVEKDPSFDPIQPPEAHSPAGTPAADNPVEENVIFVSIRDFYEINGEDNVIKTSPFTVHKLWKIGHSYGDLSKTGEEYWGVRDSASSSEILKFACPDIARGETENNESYFLFRDKNYKKFEYPRILPSKGKSSRETELRDKSEFRIQHFKEKRCYLADFLDD